MIYLFETHNVPVPELDTEPASWKTPKELRKERKEAGQIWHSSVKRRNSKNNEPWANCAMQSKRLVYPLV
jgi:hypothetical protein